jgi:arylsulfatase A-like enzyme
MKQLLSGPRHSATGVTGELLAWLDGTAATGRPFFAYLHTVEPHGPYQPAEPYRTRFAPGVSPSLGTRPSLRALELSPEPPSPATLRDLRALYDAEVAANDAAFGVLRTGLERRGLWARTVVVVTADHGEEFHEHGAWEHGGNLHSATLSIPLLVRVPNVAGRRVSRLAQQVDVAPTVLDLAGIPLPADLDGESLLPSMTGDAARAPALARSYHREEDGDEEVAVTTSAFRLLVSTRSGRKGMALYERRPDPQERRDVSAALPITMAYLRSALRWPRQGQGDLSRRAGRLGREAEQQLRALGYVN